MSYRVGDLVIRPMTASDRLPCDGGRCPATQDMRVANVDQATGSGDSAFIKATERLTNLVGATAILALDEDLVAGFVSFFPTSLPEYDFCQDGQIVEALAQLDENPPAPDHSSAALRVRCLAVREAYRGQGLGLALLAALQNWAVENGWRTIVANGCIYSGLAAYQWRIAPKPPRQFWERAGFRIAAFEPLGLPAASNEASARASFDWYLSDAFPATSPRDIPSDEPNWREVFRDYTMVWTA